jgi:hypothetical protein
MSVINPLINPSEGFMKGFMKITNPFINPPEEFIREFMSAINSKRVYERV